MPLTLKKILSGWDLRLEHFKVVLKEHEVTRADVQADMEAEIHSPEEEWDTDVMEEAEGEDVDSMDLHPELQRRPNL